MEIGCPSRFHPELLIELRKVFFQEGVRVVDGAYVVFPEFFQEPVLKGSVHAFHPSLCLWRIGEDKLYPELFANPSELGGKLLVIRGVRVVDLVRGEPVQIDGLRFSMREDVIHPEPECRGNPLVEGELGYHVPGRVIDAHEQACFPSPVFEPEVVGSVILAHFPVALLSLPHGSLGIGFPLLLRDPQSPSDEFVAQGGHGDGNGMLFLELFLHQDVGVVPVVLLHERYRAVILRTVILVVRFAEPGFMDESDIPVSYIAFLNALYLSQALVGQISRLTLQEVSSNEFVHDAFEVEFFLCHRKILGHGNGI